MQTVNFNCSHCGKLMAVGINLLGRNVRCPHCKQVVQAPASAKAVEPAVRPDAAQAPTPVVPMNAPMMASHSAPTHQQVPQPPAPAPPKQNVPTTADGQESIFAENSGDDLFGAQKTSQSNFMSQPPPPPPRPNAYNNPSRNEPARPFSSAPASPFKTSNPATEELEPLPSNEAHWDQRVSKDDGRTEEFESSAADNDLPSRSPHVGLRPEPRSSGGGIFIWMLMLYALIATGIAAYLFYVKTQYEEEQAAKDANKPHPFLAIPDFFGQYERAERKKVPKIEGMPPAEMEVPKDMQMKLNEKKTIGDLEVTPLKVEFRRTTRFRKEAGMDPYARKNSNPLFLLTLRVKNVSDDVYICPTDPAFARHRESQPLEIKPYTGLVIEKQFLLGGTFEWPAANCEYEFLEEQKDDAKPLAPKEERDYVISLDQDFRPIKAALDNAKKNNFPVLWRVELRKGLETVKDESGKDHEISVKSVIGVVLDPSDFSY